MVQNVLINRWRQVPLSDYMHEMLKKRQDQAPALHPFKTVVLNTAVIYTSIDDMEENE